MTKKILLPALALSVCLTATARPRTDNTGSFIKDCDLRISIGGSPTTAANYFTGGSAVRLGYRPIYPDNEPLSELYKDYVGPVTTSGAVIAGFNYRFSNLLSTGVHLGFTSLWKDNYNGVTETISSTDTGQAVYLLPYFRVNCFERPALRLYMSTALGMGKYFGFNELKGWRRDYDGRKYFEDKSLKFEAQFTLFGLEVGKDRFFGCLEFGIGTLYNGAGIGAGYRF